jgi:U3 small nucleolar RNA-associated protein 21
MINVGEIVIIGTRNGEIFGFDFTNPSQNICYFQVDFVPKRIIHPATYLNKILIMGDKNLELRNIRTSNRIFDFTEENTSLFSYLNLSAHDDISEEKTQERVQSNKSLISIKDSPALDIVALGISDGDIILYNLKTDKILSKFKIKGSRPTSLAFSQLDIPLLAVGDQNGDITLFNLNEKNIFKVIRSAHKSSISYIEFLKEELILISGSFDDNSLLMWQYDELEENFFRVIRKRNGLSFPIKKLSFYGDEGHHVLASSVAPESELKDFFLWNEAFEGNFSIVNPSILILS